MVSPLDTVSLSGAGTSALYYNTAYGYTGANPASLSDPYKVNYNFDSIGSLSDHHRLHFDLTWDLDSVTVKLKCGEATGFMLASTCSYLSAQPA